MKRDLLIELALVFLRESDAITQQYAWPPRAPLTDAERNERDRLDVTAKRIFYRAESEGT